ncbi:helix-turn-helix domain-containing protein [Mycobacterium riyadhense]|uniref:helix-turn-helix domain-containing protein n=1 Tax=Mycobacterium riyadhense TaxID=486698 RepID=UPI00195CD98B|nr:helix-turn-helix domain-containing protein [Mycobacterium riyadhense]
MTSRGRPTAGLGLTEEEHQTLTRWAPRRKLLSSHALALRPRIVLGCAQGLSNKQVAVRERVSPSAVGKWRRRFVEARLDGLVDDPRSGRPATVSAEQVEDVGFVVTRSEVYVQPRKLQLFPGLVSSE